VLVVDDHALMRAGLRGVVASAGIEVVGQCADGSEVEAAVERLRPDVVLMDLQMPGVGGVEATRTLRTERPQTAVVVLTTYTDDDSILAALEAGAIGYLTKNASAADIHRAIQAAASGHTLLDPQAAARLVRAAHRADNTGNTDAESDRPNGLTKREAQVLALVGQGLSNAEIAEKLYLSRSTVKTHINQIFTKTGSRDRPQAIVYANHHDIKPLDD